MTCATTTSLRTLKEDRARLNLSLLLMISLMMLLIRWGMSMKTLTVRFLTQLATCTLTATGLQFLGFSLLWGRALCIYAIGLSDSNILKERIFSITGRNSRMQEPLLMSSLPQSKQPMTLVSHQTRITGQQI